MKRPWDLSPDQDSRARAMIVTASDPNPSPAVSVPVLADDLDRAAVGIGPNRPSRRRASHGNPDDDRLSRDRQPVAVRRRQRPATAIGPRTSRTRSTSAPRRCRDHRHPGIQGGEEHDPGSRCRSIGSRPRCRGSRPHRPEQEEVDDRGPNDRRLARDDEGIDTGLRMVVGARSCHIDVDSKADVMFGPALATDPAPRIARLQRLAEGRTHAVSEVGYTSV